ncbi:hypothetical protein OOZ63_20045 [Paucibacter sp. PLA-PC-4]|uniref:hypothetical protein n=1 Tax=Paucibacter sp. PLA-PC-4 TaxID=2993655 RepID=UPI00224A7BA8|nr:hypothetical protein [Paucibacter sp. PLA-PC-4]MCX2864123.1 hypothetical protein [Paucibacter sp. PLA-PC-4]
MLIQSTNAALSSYGASFKSSQTRQESWAPAAPGTSTDTITISEAAKRMLSNSGPASGTDEVQKQLDAIKSKPAVQRSDADRAYLSEHDDRFTELQEKVQANGLGSLTSGEVDYMQKAGGLVNTMAYLSPKERAIYDDLVSKGNTEAAQGLMLVGMSRIGMEGQQVTLPGGQTFDPTKTEVTADNVRNLFRQMFVDASGNSDRLLEALASALDQRPANMT